MCNSHSLNQSNFEFKLYKVFAHNPGQTKVGNDKITFNMNYML